MADMENYTKVKVINYVKQGIENGTMIPRQAKKFARIIARQGIILVKLLFLGVLILKEMKF